MSNRNHLISFLQAFGIILVVIGHSFPEEINNLPLIRWIYSFHMPLFIFISGYLLLYVSKLHNSTLADQKMGGSNGFLAKKARRLLIPYITISTLAFFPKVYLSQYAMRPLTLSFRSWLDMLIYPWENVIIYFWFLPTLFIIMCVVVYSTKIGHKWRVKIPLSVIVVGLAILTILNPLHSIKLLNIGGVAYYLFYFVLGIYYCDKQDSIDQLLNNKKWYVFFTTFCISLLCLVYKSDVTDLMFAVNGIAMSISLGFIYSHYNSTFLSHLDGASYAIYLFSWFPQVASMQLLIKLTNLPILYSVLLASITGLYIPYLIYKIIIYFKGKYKWGKWIALLSGQ